MNQKPKNPTGGSGFSENVQDANQEQNDDTTKPIAPPKKSEVVVETFLTHQNLNTFQANKLYGDTCLHSAISTLEKKHGIEFQHVPERVINRIGKPVRVMRYRLVDIKKAQQLHTTFQRQRGIPVEE